MHLQLLQCLLWHLGRDHQLKIVWAKIIGGGGGGGGEERKEETRGDRQRGEMGR